MFAVAAPPNLYDDELIIGDRGIGARSGLRQVETVVVGTKLQMRRASSFFAIADCTSSFG